MVAEHKGSVGFWRRHMYRVYLLGPSVRQPRTASLVGCHRTARANIRFHRLRRTAGVESSFPSDL